MSGDRHFLRGAAICIAAALVGTIAYNLYTASSRAREAEIAFCAAHGMGHRELDSSGAGGCVDEQGLEHSVAEVIRASQAPNILISYR